MADDDGGDFDSGISDNAVSSLTGFLFGNIDEKGELEGDFLDEVVFCYMVMVLNLTELVCLKLLTKTKRIYINCSCHERKK